MSEYGYLGCKDCKEMIYLGKVSSDNSLFLHGQMTNELLGVKALKFLAAHINHDVFLGSDEGGTIKDEFFDIYKVVDKKYGDIN